MAKPEAALAEHGGPFGSAGRWELLQGDSVRA